MTTVHVRDFPDELHRKFKALCSLKGESMRERIIELVRAHVEREERRKK